MNDVTTIFLMSTKIMTFYSFVVIIFFHSYCLFCCFPLLHLFGPSGCAAVVPSSLFITGLGKVVYIYILNDSTRVRVGS